MRVVLLICVIVFSVFFFYPSKTSSLRRVNVVLATTPITVWSWDQKDGIFTVISLPSDVFIDAVRGYGKYSLEALWKLDSIEKGSVFALSLSHMFGLSLPWYGGSDKLVPVADPISYGREYFSFSRVFSRHRTNMPIPLYISFSRALAKARSDKIDLIDLSRKTVTYEEQVLDSSKREVVDQELMDVALKGVFEDPDIRKEGLSVALYNSTETPALGSRAARFLTHLGILVVSVGNQDQKMARCQLEASAESLTTQTARSIIEILNCDSVAVSESRRTDLTVKIGEDFASLFKPRE